MNKQFFKEYGIKDLLVSILSGVVIFVLGIFSSIAIGVFKVNEGCLKKAVIFFENNTILYNLLLLIATSVSIYFIQVRPIYKERFKNRVEKNVVTCEYEKFLSDAKSLRVFAGDLSFLKSSKEQLNKMKSLGNKCKIIFHPPSNSDLMEEMKPIYHELHKANVDLRKYTLAQSSEIANFRGQIKVDESGNERSMYIKVITDDKGCNLYEPINLDNKMVSDLVKEKFDAIHEISLHPTIKYILLDLGGVYFDGDYYKDFHEPVNELLGSDIRPRVNQKVLLDQDLNLGNVDIIRFLENKISKKISDSNQAEIRVMWNSVWTPNERMKEIVTEIKTRNFNIYPFSNLDEENGIIYIERGDFNCFSNKRFLSFEMKMTKPEKRFFDKITAELNAEPHEILVIDDQDQNIEKAKLLGFQTLKFINSELLDTELRKLNILCEK